MKKFKEFINRALGGFCMALADAVPGVSGGTIAFILGFYDDFITSLDDLFRGTMPKKKKALKFLLKLGFGWIIGMGIASTVLSNLFVDRIYDMSSLFIGLIIFSLPLIYRDEYESIHNYLYLCCSNDSYFSNGFTRNIRINNATSIWYIYSNHG